MGFFRENPRHAIPSSQSTETQVLVLSRGVQVLVLSRENVWAMVEVNEDRSLPPDDVFKCPVLRNGDKVHVLALPLNTTSI